jgi:hypothetical protein
MAPRPVLAKRKPGTKSRVVIADRLDRIEDLLVEVRGVLDVHFKRINKLQSQLETLLEKN